jgi:hypothetical protein
MGAYTRTTYNGVTLNKVTVQAFQEVEKRLGYKLTFDQGSYNTSVEASGGTHSGGGAADLAPFEADRKEHVCRAVGFAAWHRPHNWDHEGGIEHVHCELLGDEDASPAAKAQWAEYRAHRSGLVSNLVDNTWHPDPIPVWHYKVVPSLGVSVQRVHTDFLIALADKVKNKPTFRGRALQRCLNRKVGAGLTVDGVVGPKTVDAYRKWERKVGGEGRPGIPDKKSLRRLFRGTVYFVSK